MEDKICANVWLSFNLSFNTNEISICKFSQTMLSRHDVQIILSGEAVEFTSS